MRDKLLGGLYGALIGDACGVPYEFRSPSVLPSYDDIDMVPPADFNRSWDHIAVGTYSDDGAQLLCLTECLRDHKFSAVELHEVLRNWMRHGYMSVNEFTFDVGNQTSAALQTDVGTVRNTLNQDRFNGNGSLMRTLPIVFEFHLPGDIILMAKEMSSATHPHIRSQLCCAWYCLIAHYLLAGWNIQDAIDRSFADLIDRQSEHLEELLYIKNFEHNEFTGTGYVVDSFWSALSAVWRSTSYEDAIKKAIQYGNDTDTTACIAGGLAGIIYGYSGIPDRWIQELRGKDTIQRLADYLTY